MTSEERREIRYQNRKRAREQKRREVLSPYDDFENVISCSSLADGCRQSKKGVTWKASVQRYLMNLLRNTAQLHSDLSAGKDITQGFIEFDLMDRGKKRHIKSVHFKERVVQRALCDKALVPTLRRGLIYDNGASLRGKGIHFTLNRVMRHLHEYYRASGFTNDGYILTIDFSKYFDSLLHEPIYEMLDRSFTDPRLVELCKTFIRPFGKKSVGIGSQISQIIAVAYPNAIDHFIKQDLRVRFYNRYNDDSYLIHKDKEFLKQCLEILTEKYAALGITVNPKKTQIQKLSNGFTFLKARFMLTETGKVVVKPCKDSAVRMRQRLKKFRKKLSAGAMSLDDIVRSYYSWRGYIDHTSSFRTVKGMDALYKSLFDKNP